jgi:hypothetical protein
MKSEVYSWRVSTDLKTDLEHEARRQALSVSAALELAAREWLKNNANSNESEEEQQRLHRAASESLGAFEGTDARRSENVRRSVQKRLRGKHER